MIGVADWESIRQRYEDFWNHKLKGHALLQMRCPSDAKEPLPYPDEIPAKDLEDRWTNAERIRNNFLHGVYRTRYYADGYPLLQLNAGPGILPAMIGGSMMLAPNTIWFENGQVIGDYARDIDRLRLDPDAPGTRFALNLLDTAVAGAGEGYKVGVPSLGGTLDIAAALRGTQTLLTDVYDDPEGMLALAERIDELYIQAYDLFYSRLQTVQQGCSSWLSVWCPGRFHPSQCDFCAMLSPEQFDRFAMPGLIRQYDAMDYGCYHLDGAECIRHLDSLLSIPKLDTIQWVSSAGSPPNDDLCWFPLYRRIQDAGRNLIINEVDPDLAERYLGELDQSRLFLNLPCPDEKTCERILRFAETHA